MSITKYGTASPYFNTPIQDFYLDVYVDRPIPADPDDVLIELESRHINRPDILSHELYGSSKYWWVFIRRNRNSIKDPIFGMEAGLEIYVPTKNRLLNLVG